MVGMNQIMNKFHGALFFGLLAIMTFSIAGCVQRKIKINSQPEGALVYLNDQEVGRTPLTINFTWYGVYDVRLTKEGYQPLWTTAKAEAPFWENPPFDLFAEAVPNAKVVIDWNFELEKTEAKHLDVDLLLKNADQMKQWTDGEVPLPKTLAGKETKDQLQPETQKEPKKQ